MRYAHFMPEELKINGTLIPQSRYRGIYKAILYEADLAVSGNYAFPRLDPGQIGAEAVHYDNAFLQIGIPDMRGIRRSVVVDWNGDHATGVPGIPTDDIVESGIHVPVRLSEKGNYSTFSFAFNLRFFPHPVQQRFYRVREGATGPCRNRCCRTQEITDTRWFKGRSTLHETTK